MRVDVGCKLVVSAERRQGRTASVPAAASEGTLKCTKQTKRGRKVTGVEEPTAKASEPSQRSTLSSESVSATAEVRKSEIRLSDGDGSFQ